jgi:hypothetical protein
VRFILLFSVTLLLAIPTAVVAQEGGDQMGAMPEMGRPAEMDQISFMHGQWDVTMKYKMDPTGDWIEATGSAVVEPALNGCVNRTTFESTIMGMPFRGIDHTTYNREEDRFESVWIDDMSGKMSVMHGNLEGDSMVMEGTDKMQGMEFMTRSVSKKVSNDELQWTMSMSTDGGQTWFENMQMTYTRKK